MEEIKRILNVILRECRKITDFLPVAVILSLVMTIIGPLISAVLLRLPFLNNLLHSLVYSESMYIFMNDYALFLGIWIIILLTVLVFPGNHPMFKAIGYNRRGNNLKGYLVGLLLGFGTNAFCVLMSLLTGDIKLSYYGFDFVVLAAFAVVVFIQSGAEELADRFYLYQKLRRRYRHPVVAILCNSIVFALLHTGNPGFTVVAGLQIFFVGLIFSLMVYYYNNLWGAMAFHAAWNYTQNIIFGLPNSGIVSEYSIFTLEAASARNGFFYNVRFGVEGSIGATLLLAILSVIIIYKNWKKPECNDVWAQSEEKARQKSRTIKDVLFTEEENNDTTKTENT
ncbi:MAG: CPBP family intramembrane metalloprotease [Erysipelotrichaceae bacterium]|nr:CPBP family intramembrane metalloprotease [Erysipelotrichaceae bacterium]